MSSYIYMKILESSPSRYDRGIALLSLGAATRVKRRIVEENVRPGMKVLEIGCGTGTLAVYAAEKGADVTGFDIAASMLDIARGKTAAADLGDRVTLMEMGIAGMAKLADDEFDLVMSTLVFSELSHDEQRFAFKHAHRVLKSGGVLAIADEVTPSGMFRKLVYGAVRLPLLLITFVSTQTVTHPVRGLTRLVQEADFEIVAQDRSAFGSFLYLSARKA